MALHDRPNYYYRGYHYLYDNDRWYYTTNTGDHWHELPRSSSDIPLDEVLAFSYQRNKRSCEGAYFSVRQTLR